MDTKKRGFKLPFLDLSDSTKRTRWLLRVVSLAFAVILWLFVTWDGTTLSVRSWSVPLRYLDIPDGYALSNTVKNIDVRLEGRLETLALMNRNLISASVGLADPKPGKYRLPVQLNTPANVRVLSYQPQFVEFELFRMIERTLRPTLVLHDELPTNLAMTEVVMNPTEVVVKGPEPRVMAVKQVELQSSVEELLTDGTRDIPVVLTAEDGVTQDLIVEPPKVRVTVKIAEATEEIRVPVRISVTGTPGGSLQVGNIVISPDVVTLRGTTGELANITEVALDAIDVTGQTGDMNVDIPMESPSKGISIVNAESVNVRIELHTATETRTFLNVPVVTLGKSVYDEWNVNPPTVSATVERSVLASRQFDLENPPFELYVDVTNVVSSQLTLPVLVRNLESGMRVLRIEPSQVTISAENP